MLMELSRRKNENEAQYIWRLSSAKDSGLLDMSWDEIANVINTELGYDNTSSAYRKQYASAKKFLEAGVFDSVNNEKYLKELDEKRLALETERQKLYATKVERTRQIRQIGRQELFYQNIANQLSAINPPSFMYSTGEGIDLEKEYILTISDIHAGADFETQTNSYSLEEMSARFDQLFDETISKVKSYDIKTLKVLCLGDTIQGILRISDLQLNETSVVEATVYVAKCISSFLNELSKYCHVIYYHVPTANHTQLRPLGTKASEIRTEDIEYIIGHYIRDVLVQNKNIVVNLGFGKEYIEVPIFNETAIALHGHQIKDVNDALKTLCIKNHKFYNAVFLGHYHAPSMRTAAEDGIKDIEIIVCPSFIGTDPYTDTIFKGARPACGLYVFDIRNGLIRSEKIPLT